MARVGRSFGGTLALWFAACATAGPPLPESDVRAPYRLGAEDVIEVTVHGAATLSRTLPVRPDGRISLPLLGELEAEGRTARELADELQVRFAAWVAEPRVAVIVREVNAPRFFVVGEVAHPGAFPLRGRVDVLQALAIAGGFATFADRDDVVLIRRVGGREHRARLDLDALLEDGGVAPLVAPGDTLFVP